MTTESNRNYQASRRTINQLLHKVQTKCKKSIDHDKYVIISESINSINKTYFILIWFLSQKKLDFEYKKEAYFKRNK